MKIAETYEEKMEQIESSKANESQPSTMSSQTAEFVDANVGEILDFKTSVTQEAPTDNQSTLGLAEFLSRPTLISTSSWTTSAFTTSTINPWQLFFNDAVIKNKISNFAYFRGDLKIKIVVNCSPFYYGALIAYYSPINSPNLASTAVDFVTVSQRPHIWIYPQTSSGGELHIPFFYHKNYVSLTTAATLGSLGSLTFKQYTALTSANGATSNGCTIQVYAWVENAQLQGNSTGAVMQSGRVRDEYGNGPVSAPAAALSNWAQHLRDVPIIGKYATATQIGSSAVSRIAQLFGWSNVPVIEDVKPMKNVPFHDLASAHLSEPTSKMTFDPKGEISVDPTITGLSNVDEMILSNMLQHESFLTSSSWTTSDTVGTQYFFSAVTPMLYDRGTASSGGTYGIAMTPMCHVSRAFTHWRGDIIFRFKVICSRFHQGRLRISWDPTAANSGTTDNTNVILTKVIDLAESDEVEFRVPYMQAAQWCNTTNYLGEIYTTNNWLNGAGSRTLLADTTNGAITVKCLTNLSAPTDTATVTILTFVRAADNFILANPCDLPPLMSWLQMQSGVAQIDDGKISEDFHKINFGDPVLSLRTLLRRSVKHDVRVVVGTASTGVRITTSLQGRQPLQPGYDTNGYLQVKGVETPATSYGFNAVAFTPLSWFSPAFIATRGAIRWHYLVNINCDAAGFVPVDVDITRGTNSVVTGSNQLIIQDISSTLEAFRGDTKWKGASGTALTHQITQSGVSVEMPMNSQYKFTYTLPTMSTIGSQTDGTEYDTYRMRVTMGRNNSASSTAITRYVCAGTDYGLHFYLGVPVLYYNPSMGQNS